LRTETATFYSRGARLAGLWRCPEPDTIDERLPAVVQGPGWLGLKESKLYVRYHQALVEAGIAVLVFDYRGCGESEGDRSLLSPASQLEDLVAAVSYASGREDVDPDRIGVFGTGGTGGGNAVLLARRDSRVRAAVSQVPVADGEDWLHRMRSEEEWLRFLRGLEEDRRLRATTGRGRLVDPRQEIMVATAERGASGAKADVDSRAPDRVSLEGADEILNYRPIDAARGLPTPLLVIGVEDDAVTPTDHALRLYEAAAGPRRLILQRKTTHYAAYDRYWSAVTPEIVGWFQRHLVSHDLIVRTANNDAAEGVAGSRF
jgi:dipeptidyl aminopeptidase/acylaminoacyl peptidase